MRSDLITVAVMVVIVLDIIQAAYHIVQMWGQIHRRVMFRGVVLGVVRLGLPLRNVAAGFTAVAYGFIRIRRDGFIRRNAQ